MIIDRNTAYQISLFEELRKLPKETEWVEFKHDNENPERIGEYLSGLANSAALLGKANAYVLWGVDDSSHEILGTDFSPTTLKVGNEELENWLLRLLSPKIDFQFHELCIENKLVVLLEIGAAFRHPVQFKNQEFIRVGSYLKKLKDQPEKERKLWRVFDRIPFENQVAAENLSSEKVLELLNYPSYFDLLKLPLPPSSASILSALVSEELIRKGQGEHWEILNLGAVLFAKRLDKFRGLKRKAVRVIVYSGDNRVKTIREQEGALGYASGFEGLIGYIVNLLPSNEVIGQALRKAVPMFPELAVRELVANAIIHQDFQLSGTGPMIEIFASRMEVTNPGTPLVSTDRFLDSPPRSRNEAIASFMRRIGVCEERGSGIDKVVFESEFYQLPAPVFESTDEQTRCVLFAHKPFRDMDKQDRVRATYQHACLRYVQRDYMTNTSLRKRFGIEVQNSAMISRIIKDTIAMGMVKPFDESASRKYMKYLPWWA